MVNNDINIDKVVSGFIKIGDFQKKNISYFFRKSYACFRHTYQISVVYNYNL